MVEVGMLIVSPPWIHARATERHLSTRVADTVLS
jgi:hypothetical protein